MMDSTVRRVLRSVFTKEVKIIRDRLREGSDPQELSARLTSLTSRYDQIKQADTEILKAMESDSQVKESELEMQYLGIGEYELTYNVIKEQLLAKLNSFEKTPDNLVQSHSCSHSLDLPLKRKRPDIKKFDGDIRGWIAFWAQFEKIHQDLKLQDEDKFAFLLDSLTLDSPAMKLIEGFPPSRENYSKAVGVLKSRYGKDEFLIEFYVRELLSLVLSRSEDKSVSQLYDELSAQLRALDSLGVTTEKYAAIIFPLVESAVPEHIFKVWERHRISKNASIKEPSDCLKELLDFLKIEVDGEERLKLRQNSFGSQCERSQKQIKGGNSSVPSAATLMSLEDKDEKVGGKAGSICIFCDKGHMSSDCFVAVDMSLSERNDILRKRGACFRCLKRNHVSSKCRAFVKCVLCKGKHYVIMCSKTDDTREKGDSVEVKSMLSSDTLFSVTYLQTLVAKVINGGLEYKVRILLDSGSQKSYILKSCAQEFKLKREGKMLVRQELFGGQKTAVKSHGKYEVTLCSMTNTFQCTIMVLDQEKICGFIPKLSDSSIIQSLESKGIVLSDACGSYQDTEVQLLLGADAWPLLVTNNGVQLSKNLMATQTKLGWTLIGSSNQEEGVTSTLLTTLTCQTNISNFWDLELLGIESPSAKMTQADKDREVDNFFKSSIQRDQEGRYIVKIPWIPGLPSLEENRSVAVKRLTSTTNKLKTMHRFDDYDSVIKLWLKLGIVEAVPPSELGFPCYYLPHRAVVKENSTTPVRPVFDASSLDRNGRSLNGCIEKGPNLIELIMTCLTNFRLYPIAVTADIEKAFLQIVVDSRDRDFLRFLWWNEDEILTLRHCRVVFGVSSSPYFLCAVLKYHLENAVEFKETASKLLRSFYVDNCLTGVSTENELISLKYEAQHLLSSAGFNLRGWVSNIDNDDNEENILGLNWACKRDVLSCNVKFLDSVPTAFTRRTLLSIAQRVYDPVGFITPSSIVPKALLQRSWDKSQSWDDVLTEDIQSEFKQWLKNVYLLGECKVKRYIPLNESSTIHIFCDASKIAYACCIFVRTELEGEVVIHLLTSKSRVSPAKSLTLPRLELMAAVIGVRLYNQAVLGHPFSNCKAFFWTDASVVIAWISRQVQWSVFVDNRVREIRETCDRWKHVPGVMNPADLLSRGCNPEQLVTSRWWEGPSWLYLPQDEWPVSGYVENTPEIFQEVRKTMVAAAVTDTNDFFFSSMIERCEKYSTIVRAVARVIDAICILSPGFTKFCGLTEDLIMNRCISGEKFINAEVILFRAVQKEYFTEDVRKAVLKKLDFYYDDRGVLRLKTRLLRGDHAEDVKYPIILPHKHPLIEKMIVHEHKRNNHAGTLTLMTLLRERVWLFQCRRSVNRIVKKCVACKRFQAKPLDAPEAPLPRHRISAEATFETTGVDLAGPLFLATGEKCWVILFTCSVYRAVHLDLLLSLTSEALIQALRRFIARRGRPRTIQSDNGTNFVGLDNLFGKLDWNAIHEECSLQRISWKFNPPTAAWWGGYWERLVRILKDLLKRNLGHASLLQEEMYTLLCECESIMNNRPLTYLSEDPTELITLKPVMFLNSLIEHDVGDLDKIEENTLERRYKYLQDVRQGLRSRFNKEYLAFLRTGMKKRIDSVQVGDVVLIGNERKRIYWPLGKVKELMPGSDGIVRLVKLQTASGEIVRPIQRLYPLEVHTDENTDSTPAEAPVIDLTEEVDEDLPVVEESEGEESVEEESTPKRTRSGRTVKPREIMNL